jgi:hypothetical protein
MSGARNDALAKIEAALKEVAAISRGDHKWRMRVPVDPEDSDEVITHALLAARELVRAVAPAGAHEAALRDLERVSAIQRAIDYFDITAQAYNDKYGAADDQQVALLATLRAALGASAPRNP